MTDSTDNARGPERDAIAMIEASEHRQHFTDVRHVTVRWEPYKPDGQRQMKAKGRWQEQVGSGDYWRWQNCDRPAFAHDPDPLGALRVRPLVWEYHPAGAIAAPPTGFAYIIDTRMKGRVYSLKGFNPQREFSSMDEAKAAAQADYETRIRSALEPCDPQDERVAALVEALKRIAEASDHYSNEADAENKWADTLAYAHKSTCNLARAALAAFNIGDNDE